MEQVISPDISCSGGYLRLSIFSAIGQEVLMHPMFRTVSITLPSWVPQIVTPGVIYDTQEKRMELAIELSRQNVIHETGGPFGAALFDSETGELIAVGVNRVVPCGSSALHAEMVAILFGQQMLESFELSVGGTRNIELVTSTQPCIQCFGASWWSGASKMVCGAPAASAQAIGFDEGPVPPNWVELLATRTGLPPIEVVEGVLADEASAVHRLYAEKGGAIYNAGKGGSQAA